MPGKDEREGRGREDGREKERKHNKFCCFVLGSAVAFLVWLLVIEGKKMRVEFRLSFVGSGSHVGKSSPRSSATHAAFLL